MSPEEIEEIYEDREPDAARSILLPLAEGGNPVAQFFMGHLCDEQSPSDQAAAVSWYRMSSDGGFLDGTHYLASFLYYGFGTSQNIDEALELFEMAAHAGHSASQWKLGQHLLTIPGRRAQAIRWLQLAAEQEHPAAIELLKGISGDKDA